jgi:hypothetical protein
VPSVIENTRPSIGCAPSIGNAPSVTNSVRTCSGAATLVTITVPMFQSECSSDGGASLLAAGHTLEMQGRFLPDPA